MSLAPGTTAPLWSVTRPRRVAVWAPAGGASRMAASTKQIGKKQISFTKTETACCIGLFRPIAEIVEQRHAVRFGPDPNLPGILVRGVVPLNSLLAVKCDREMVALE